MDLYFPGDSEDIMGWPYRMKIRKRSNSWTLYTIRGIASPPGYFPNATKKASVICLALSWPPLNCASDRSGGMRCRRRRCRWWWAGGRRTTGASCRPGPSSTWTTSRRPRTSPNTSSASGHVLLCICFWSHACPYIYRHVLDLHVHVCLYGRNKYGLQVSGLRSRGPGLSRSWRHVVLVQGIRL